MWIHDELWDAVYELVGPGWRDLTTDQFEAKVATIQGTYSLAEVLRATTALGRALLRRRVVIGAGNSLDAQIDWVLMTAQSWAPFKRTDIAMALRTLQMEEDSMAGVPINAVVFVQLVVIAVLAEQSDDPSSLLRDAIVALSQDDDPDIGDDPLPDGLWAAISTVVNPYNAYNIDMWGRRYARLLGQFDVNALADVLGPVVYDLIRDECGDGRPDRASLDAVIAKVERTIDAWVIPNHDLVVAVVRGLIHPPIAPMSMSNLVEAELFICIALLAYYTDVSEPIRRTRDETLAGTAGS